MSETSGFLENLRTEASRVGYRRALERSLYSVAKNRLRLRRIELIQLPRDELSPLVPSHRTRTARVATEPELLSMQRSERWPISKDLVDGFRNGETCLLSFVDGELGGYTWISSSGCPEILPGLRIRIPDDYLYNFAGYTAPEYRGLGLQSFRHHAVLNQPHWMTKKGMFGYVECTNWSSKKGQSKSGYQSLGQMTLLGENDRIRTFIDDGLRRAGVRRMHD